MKYTFIEKLKSVIYNLLKTKLSHIFLYWYSKISYKTKVKYEDIFSGDITREKDYDPRDYNLEKSDIYNLPILYHDKIYMIDQGRKWRLRNSCVVVNSYLALCNNLKIKPSYNFYLELLNKFEKDGLWSETNGASIPKIVKALCDYWNKLYPNREVTYYRLFKDWSATEKGYRVIGGRNTFPDYGKDIQDRKIDFSDYEDKKRRGGHCITIMDGKILRNAKKIEVYKDKELEYTFEPYSDKLSVVNSYPTIHGELNLYEHEKLMDHCGNDIWYNWFYLIIEQNPKEFKYKFQDKLDRAKELGISNLLELERATLRKESILMNLKVFDLLTNKINKLNKRIDKIDGIEDK